jgi:hypothetical protein
MLGARATSNATGEDSLTLDGVRRDRPAWRSALACPYQSRGERQRWSTYIARERPAYLAPRHYVP